MTEKKAEEEQTKPQDQPKDQPSERPETQTTQQADNAARMSTADEAAKAGREEDDRRRQDVNRQIEEGPSVPFGMAFRVPASQTLLEGLQGDKTKGDKAGRSTDGKALKQTDRPEPGGAVRNPAAVADFKQLLDNQRRFISDRRDVGDADKNLRNNAGKLAPELRPAYTDIGTALLRGDQNALAAALSKHRDDPNTANAVKALGEHLDKSGVRLNYQTEEKQQGDKKSNQASLTVSREGDSRSMTVTAGMDGKAQTAVLDNGQPVKTGKETEFIADAAKDARQFAQRREFTNVKDPARGTEAEPPAAPLKPGDTVRGADGIERTVNADGSQSRTTPEGRETTYRDGRVELAYAKPIKVDGIGDVSRKTTYPANDPQGRSERFDIVNSSNEQTALTTLKGKDGKPTGAIREFSGLGADGKSTERVSADGKVTEVRFADGRFVRTPENGSPVSGRSQEFSSNGERGALDVEERTGRVVGMRFTEGPRAGQEYRYDYDSSGKLKAVTTADGKQHLSGADGQWDQKTLETLGFNLDPKNAKDGRIDLRVNARGELTAENGNGVTQYLRRNGGRDTYDTNTYLRTRESADGTKSTDGWDGYGWSAVKNVRTEGGKTVIEFDRSKQPEAPPVPGALATPRPATLVRDAKDNSIKVDFADKSHFDVNFAKNTLTYKNAQGQEQHFVNSGEVDRTGNSVWTMATRDSDGSYRFDGQQKSKDEQEKIERSEKPYKVDLSRPNEVTAHYRNGARVVSDGQGKVKTITQANGQQFKFEHDADGKLSTVKGPDGTTYTRRGGDATGLDGSQSERWTMTAGQPPREIGQYSGSFDVKPNGTVVKRELDGNATTYEGNGASIVRRGNDVIQITEANGQKWLSRRPPGSGDDARSANTRIWRLAGDEKVSFTGTAQPQADGSVSFDTPKGTFRRNNDGSTSRFSKQGTEQERNWDNGAYLRRDEQTGQLKETKDARGVVRQFDWKKGEDGKFTLNEVKVTGPNGTTTEKSDPNVIYEADGSRTTKKLDGEGKPAGFDRAGLDGITIGVNSKGQLDTVKEFDAKGNPPDRLVAARDQATNMLRAVDGQGKPTGAPAALTDRGVATRNEDGTYSMRRPDGSVERLDAAGNFRSLTDKDGRLARLADSRGGEAEFAYKDGKLSEVKVRTPDRPWSTDIKPDADGNFTVPLSDGSKEKYNAQGKLTKREFGDGSSMEFDPATGALSRTRDVYGVERTFKLQDAKWPPTAVETKVPGQPATVTEKLDRNGQLRAWDSATQIFGDRVEYDQQTGTRAQVSIGKDNAIQSRVVDTLNGTHSEGVGAAERTTNKFREDRARAESSKAPEAYEPPPLRPDLSRAILDANQRMRDRVVDSKMLSTRDSGIKDAKTGDGATLKHQKDVLLAHIGTLPDAQQTQMLDSMKAFEARAKKDGISPQEVAKTYYQANRLLEADPAKINNGLDKADFARTAQALLHGAAKPGDTNQGNKRTCNVTVFREAMLKSSPSLAGQVAADAMTSPNGVYEAPDGQKIKLDLKSMKADREAEVSSQVSKWADENGTRDQLGQVLDHVLVNYAHQTQIKEWSNKAKGDVLPDAVYRQTRPTGQSDTGERLKMPGENQRTRSHPSMDTDMMARVSETFLGYNSVLVNTETDPKAAKATKFDGHADMEKKLAGHLEKGRMVPILVHDGHPAISDGRRVGTAHIFNVTDSKTIGKEKYFRVSDSAGESGDKWISSKDLFNSSRGTESHTKNAQLPIYRDKVNADGTVALDADGKPAVEIVKPANGDVPADRRASLPQPDAGLAWRNSRGDRPVIPTGEVVLPGGPVLPKAAVERVQELAVAKQNQDISQSQQRLLDRDSTSEDRQAAIASLEKQLASKTGEERDRLQADIQSGKALVSGLDLVQSKDSAGAAKALAAITELANGQPPNAQAQQMIAQLGSAAGVAQLQTRLNAQDAPTRTQTLSDIRTSLEPSVNQALNQQRLNKLTESLAKADNGLDLARAEAALRGERESLERDQRNGKPGSAESLAKAREFEQWASAAKDMAFLSQADKNDPESLRQAGDALDRLVAQSAIGNPAAHAALASLVDGTGDGAGVKNADGRALPSANLTKLGPAADAVRLKAAAELTREIAANGGRVGEKYAAVLSKALADARSQGSDVLAQQLQKAVNATLAGPTKDVMVDAMAKAVADKVPGATTFAQEVVKNATPQQLERSLDKLMENARQGDQASLRVLGGILSGAGDTKMQERAQQAMLDAAKQDHVRKHVVGALKENLANDNGRALSSLAELGKQHLDVSGIADRAVYAGLDSSDGRIRQSAIQALVNKPDWSPQDVNAIREHLSPQMAQALRSVPPELLDRHKEALTKPLSDKIKAASGEVTPAVREASIQLSAMLGGIKGLESAGLKVQQDAQDKTRYNVTDKDGTTYQLRDHKGNLRIESLQRKDGSDRVNYYDDGKDASFHHSVGRDGKGNTTTRDANDSPTLIEKATGERIAVEYKDGRPSRFTDSSGNQWDSSDGKQWQKRFSEEKFTGELKLQADGSSALPGSMLPAASQIKQDDQKRIAEVKAADGSTTTYKYEGASKQPASIEKQTANGLERTTFGADGAITGKTLTNRDGSVTTFDARGKIASVQLPPSKELPGGGTRKFSWDESGKLLKITEPDGKAYTSNDGRNFKVPGADEWVSGKPFVKPTGEYGWQTDSGKIVERQKNGLAVKEMSGSRLGKDDGSLVIEGANGSIKGVQDANGVMRSIERDPKTNEAAKVTVGDKVWTKGANGEWTAPGIPPRSGSFDFDEKGNFTFKDSKSGLMTESRTDGSTILKDKDGKVLESITPDGRSTRFGYGPDNQLTSTKMPDGTSWLKMPGQPERWRKDGTTEFFKGSRSVDTDGNLRLKEAGKPETVHQADGWQRRGEGANTTLVRENVDGSSVTKNAQGQIIETKDGKGAVRKYGYGPDGQINSFTAGDGTWNTSDGKTWTKQGSNPPETRDMRVALTESGDHVESYPGKRERVSKADGSVLEADRGKITNVVDAKGNSTRIGYGSDGKPNKLTPGSGDGSYLATEDGVTWKQYSAKGEVKPGTEVKQKISIATDGGIVKEFADRKEMKYTDGSTKTAGLDGRLQSEVTKDGTTRSFNWNEDKTLKSVEEKRPDGTRTVSDARGRVIEASKGDVKRTFEYDENDRVTRFTERGKEWVLARPQDQNSLEYANKANPNEKFTGYVTVAGDGGIRTQYGGGREVFETMEGKQIVSMENGSLMVRRAGDGKLVETVATSGFRTQYEYGVRDVHGNEDTVGTMRYGDPPNQTVWKSSDGYDWRRESDGERWEGFQRLDQQTGERQETNKYGTRWFHRVDGSTRPQENRETDQLARSVWSAIDDNWRYSSRAAAVSNVLRDRTADEIFIARQRWYENKVGGDEYRDMEAYLKDYLNDSHYLTQATQYLHRRSTTERELGYEQQAEQLRVNLQERSQWVYGRSDSEVDRHTREILGPKSDYDLRQIQDMYQKRFGVSLHSDFTTGKYSNYQVNRSEFHREAVQLYTQKGVDARTAPEQAHLMHVAAKSGNLDYIRESMQKDRATDDGRAKFRADGGLDEIRRAFTTTHSDEAGGTYETVDAMGVREATDYAERGELRASTQIMKATGIMSNNDANVNAALERLTPVERAQYFDGKKLASDLAAQKITVDQINGKEADKKAYEFYKDLRQAIEGLHFRSVDRHALNYEDQVRTAGGGLITADIAPHGGSLYADSNQTNLSALENMSRANFERLMANAPTGAIKSDGSMQTYQDAVRDAIAKNYGSPESWEKGRRATDLVNAKIERAKAINEATDAVLKLAADGKTGEPAANAAIERLQKELPALSSMSTEQVKELLKGYQLSKQIESGQRIDESLFRGRQLDAALTAGKDAKKSVTDGAALESRIKDTAPEEQFDTESLSPAEKKSLQDYRDLQAFEAAEAGKLTHQQKESQAESIERGRQLQTAIKAADNIEKALQEAKQYTPSVSPTESQRESLKMQADLQRYRDGEAKISASDRAALEASRADQSGKLSPGDQSALAASRADQTLRPFLGGREVSRRLEDVTRDPNRTNVQKLADDKAARETLTEKERTDLDAYGDRLYQTVKDTQRRSLKEALNDNEHFFGNDRKEMYEAIQNMTPAERQRYASDENYRNEINGLVDGLIKDGPRGEVAKSLLKQVQEHPEKRPEMSLTDRLNMAAGVDHASQADVLRMIKDGTADPKTRAALLNDDSFKRAATAAIGGEAGYNAYVKPLLEKNYLPASTWKDLHTTPAAGENPPSLNHADFFKDAVLNASPEGLAALKADGKQKKELLDSMPNDQWRQLAQNVIDQGSARTEDRLRAFALGAGVSKDEAKAMLEGLKTDQQRVANNSAYTQKYGDLRTQMMDKVDADSEKRDFLRLTRINEWSTQMSQSFAAESVQRSDGSLGSLAHRWDASRSQMYMAMADYNQAVAQMKGAEMPVEMRDQFERGVQEALANFRESKAAMADAIVDGAITVAAIATAPVSGGTSLALLTVAAGGAQLGTKAALMGNDFEGTVRGIGGELASGATKFWVNRLGPEAFASAPKVLGMGSKVATDAAGMAIKEAGLTGLKAEAQTALRKGMQDVVVNGIVQGGGKVPDHAIAQMTSALVKKGLLKESEAVMLNGALKSGLQDALKAEASTMLKAAYAKARNELTSMTLNVSAGSAGAVLGHAVESKIRGRELRRDEMLQAAFTGGMFASVMHTGMRGFHAAREGSHGIGARGAESPSGARAVVKPDPSFEVTTGGEARIAEAGQKVAVDHGKVVGRPDSQVVATGPQAEVQMQDGSASIRNGARVEAGGSSITSVHEGSTGTFRENARAELHDTAHGVIPENATATGGKPEGPHVILRDQASLEVHSRASVVADGRQTVVDVRKGATDVDVKLRGGTAKFSEGATGTVRGGGTVEVDSGATIKVTDVPKGETLTIRIKDGQGKAEIDPAVRDRVKIEDPRAANKAPTGGDGTSPAPKSEPGAGTPEAKPDASARARDAAPTSPDAGAPTNPDVTAKYDADGLLKSTVNEKTGIRTEYVYKDDPATGTKVPYRVMTFEPVGDASGTVRLVPERSFQQDGNGHWRSLAPIPGQGSAPISTQIALNADGSVTFKGSSFAPGSSYLNVDTVIGRSRWAESPKSAIDSITIHPDGKRVVHFADNAEVHSAKDGKVTQMKTAEGVVSKFGYDDKGALNQLEVNNRTYVRRTDGVFYDETPSMYRSTVNTMRRIAGMEELPGKPFAKEIKINSDGYTIKPTDDSPLRMPARPDEPIEQLVQNLDGFSEVRYKRSFADAENVPAAPPPTRLSEADVLQQRIKSGEVVRQPDGTFLHRNPAGYEVAYEGSGAVQRVRNAQGRDILIGRNPDGNPDVIEIRQNGQKEQRFRKHPDEDLWYSRRPDGTVDWYRDVKVEPDGTLTKTHWSPTDKSVDWHGVKQRPDGLEIKFNDVGKETISGTELVRERARVEAASRQVFKTPEQQQRFSKLMQDFEKAAANRVPPLSAQEIANVYYQADRLLTSQNALLSLEQRGKLAEQFFIKAGDTSKISQGYFNTCNVTADVQHRLMANSPSDVLRLATDVAVNGRFIADDGTIIDMTHMKNTMTPFREAGRLGKQFDPVHNTDITVDGKRDFFDQIVQSTAIETYWQRQHVNPHDNAVVKPATTIHELRDGKPYRPGDLRYELGEIPGNNTGEFISDYSKNPPERLKARDFKTTVDPVTGKKQTVQELVPADAPNLSTRKLHDIGQQITGRLEGPHMIARVGEGELSAIQVKDPDHLASELQKMQNSGRMPITARVDTRDSVISGRPEHGGSGGAHVINIQRVYQQDGKWLVDFTNQWGAGMNRTGVPVEDMFRAMEGRAPEELPVPRRKQWTPWIVGGATFTGLAAAGFTNSGISNDGTVGPTPNGGEPDLLRTPLMSTDKSPQPQTDSVAPSPPDVVPKVNKRNKDKKS